MALWLLGTFWRRARPVLGGVAITGLTTRKTRDPGLSSRLRTRQGPRGAHRHCQGLPRCQLFADDAR